MISVLQFLRDVPAPSGPGTRRVMTFRQSAEKKCQPHGPLAGEQETVPRAPCGLAGAIAPRRVPGRAGKCTEFRGPPGRVTPFPRIGKVFPPGRRKDAFSAPFGRCWRLLFVPSTVCDAAPLCREPVCRRTLLHRIRSGVFCGLFRRLCFAAGGLPARSVIRGNRRSGCGVGLTCKTAFPGALVAVALPGPQAAGPVPVVPANDLIVSYRVFARFMTGMRKGQMPPRLLRRPGPGLPGAAMTLSAVPGLICQGSCRSGGGESFPALSRRLPPCPARCVPPVLRWPRGRPGVAARLRFCKRVLHGRCRPWPVLRAGPQAAGVRIAAGAPRRRRRRLYPGPVIRYCIAGRLHGEPDRRRCHHADRHHGDPPGVGLQRRAMKRKK